MTPIEEQGLEKQIQEILVAFMANARLRPDAAKAIANLIEAREKEWKKLVETWESGAAGLGIEHVLNYYRSKLSEYCDEIKSLQSTITQQQERIKELENGRQKMIDAHVEATNENNLKWQNAINQLEKDNEQEKEQYGMDCFEAGENYGRENAYAECGFPYKKFPSYQDFKSSLTKQNT